MDELTVDKRQFLNSVLKRNERLIWTGEPGKKWALSQGYFYLYYGAPLLGITIILSFMDIKGSVETKIWVLSSFFLFSMILIVQPLFSLYKYSRSIYAITDKRAIICEGFFKLKVYSYGPRKLKYRERTAEANGYGDIVWDNIIEVYDVKNSTAKMKSIGFMGIPNTKEVDMYLDEIE